MRSAVFGFLCLIVFCVPWQEMAVIPGLSTLSVLLGATTGLLAMIAMLLRGTIRRWPPALICLLLYVAWTILSCAWSIDRAGSQERSLTFVQVFGLAWLIFEFVDTQRRLFALILSYIGGTCVTLTSMFIMGQSVYVRSNVAVRLTGAGMNQNDVAATLCIAIVLATYLAASSTTNSVLRKLLWFYIPWAYLGVFLTGSRMGIIVLAGESVFLAWMAKVSGIKAVIALFLVGCVMVYYIPRFIESATFERVAEGAEAGTYESRIGFWKAGLEDWSEHPLQGCGVGGFVTAITPRVQHANVSHNTFITVLVETGIVGACLATLYWLLLLRSVLQMPGQMRVLWLGTFAVWAACSVAITWDYHKDTWLVYGLVLACSATLKEVPLKYPVAQRFYATRR